LYCIKYKRAPKVNPVPKKKHEPKAPSLIVKDDTVYSIPCKRVKIIAKIIVITEPYNIPALFLNMKE
jgi:hypothetical protein